MWEGSRAGSDDIPESRTPGTGTGTLPFAGAYREGIGGFTLYALGLLLAYSSPSLLSSDSVLQLHQMRPNRGLCPEPLCVA